MNSQFWQNAFVAVSMLMILATAGWGAYYSHHHRDSKRAPSLINKPSDALPLDDKGAWATSVPAHPAGYPVDIITGSGETMATGHVWTPEGMLKLQQIFDIVWAQLQARTQATGEQATSLRNEISRRIIATVRGNGLEVTLIAATVLRSFEKVI